MTLDEFKKQLGDIADGYSNEQLAKLMDLENRLADMFFDLWIDHKKNAKTVANIDKSDSISYEPN